MDLVNRLIGLYDRRCVQSYGLTLDDVACVSRGTQKLDGQCRSEQYKGRLVVVKNNGSIGVVLLDRKSPIDLVDEWVDLDLLPNQEGVKITRADGLREVYTGDKPFIDAVVKSWSHVKRIDE
ncbi:MAG TPA: hypothetical protein VJA47_02515 [archaeon]|nr:hypothetical protein [archaeon]